MSLDVGECPFVAQLLQCYHQLAGLELAQPHAAGFLQLAAQLGHLVGLFAVLLTLFTDTLFTGLQQTKSSVSELLDWQLATAAFTYLCRGIGGG